MQHLGTLPLRTPRLILRPFAPEDAEPMFRNWASDPEVTKFLTWPPHDSPEVTRWVVDSWVANYEKPDYYQWAIELDGEPIGAIAVVEFIEESQAAGIGYCIGRSWWHRGIMTEALNGVMDFLFEQVGVNRIYACHDVNNPNSGGVMKKCGMTREGILRAHSRNNQGLCDTVYYGILKSEWK